VASQGVTGLDPPQDEADGRQYRCDDPDDHPGHESHCSHWLGIPQSWMNIITTSDMPKRGVKVI
jgi:hypothetical protein